MKRRNFLKSLGCLPFINQKQKNDTFDSLCAEFGYEKRRTFTNEIEDSEYIIIKKGDFLFHIIIKYRGIFYPLREQFIMEEAWYKAKIKTTPP